MLQQSITSDTHVPTVDEQAEFEKRYQSAVVEENKVPARELNGRRVIWSPQDGSQVAFMQCPIFECLFHGTRGNGKTDSLLMAFAQFVGKGFGSAWRGVIFRQTYPQLADIQAKSEKWFRQIFPDAKFNRAKMMWEWPTGEVLLFRHMAKYADYWNYHGHEYPFIGWEELTAWANDECFKAMMACCRSSTPGVPRMIRATTNPYGIGHNWVKRRYRLSSGRWTKTVVIRDAVDIKGRPEPDRCSLYGHVRQNLILLQADPDYAETITASAINPAMADAWLDGSWDIIAGGMFDDVWVPDHNVVPRFNIPVQWRIDRSFDWGSSKPFSVGWWAESDGSDVVMHDGSWRSTVRGDLFRIKEWYGWTGQDNQGLKMLAVDVAAGIVERELLWGLKDYTKAGPADSSIYDVENGVSIARDMEKPIRVAGKIYRGVHWTRADKRPGSRKTGWEMMRKMMKWGHPNADNTPREHPGLFVVGEECDQWLRTVLSLPRDEKNMDDVDTKAEDHAGDESRYRVRASGTLIEQHTTTGMF